MCDKDCNTSTSNVATTRRMQTRSMIKKLTQQNNTTTKTSSLSARRTRTKRRKPKYLSLLRLEPPPRTAATTQKSQRRQQPKKQQDEKDMHMHEHVEKDMQMHEHEHEDNNVAFLFESSYSSAKTLNELLSCNNGETTTTTDDGFNGWGGRESDGACSTLVRTAMKGKERDVSEEKWVVYSEVVEKKDEEVTSCCNNNSSGGFGGLCLKLDYEEILNAWSDKGSLYIEGESQSPQTVPDSFPSSNSNVSIDGWGSAGNVWRVPDIGGGSFSGLKIMREVGGESFNMGRREASVLRYKEKRRCRLFAKRIRYEVRKLNAEKRPRMKGRFVKRS